MNIEIKVKAEPSERDIRAFQMLGNIKGVNVGEGCVICFANDFLPLNDNNYIVPVSLI